MHLLIIVSTIFADSKFLICLDEKKLCFCFPNVKGWKIPKSNC